MLRSEREATRTQLPGARAATQRSGVLVRVSEPLQVLDYRALLLVRQRRPVHLTTVAIAWYGRVVPEEMAALGFGHVRHEPHILLVEHVVAPVERCRPP